MDTPKQGPHGFFDRIRWADFGAGGSLTVHTDYRDCLRRRSTVGDLTSALRLRDPDPTPLGEVISGLLKTGMTLDWLHEHDAVTWHMFDVLVQGADGLWRWPDKPWLPLAFSLRATRR